MPSWLAVACAVATEVEAADLSLLSHVALFAFETGPGQLAFAPMSGSTWRVESVWQDALGDGADPEALALGCYAAAKRLAGESWARYAEMGRSCQQVARALEGRSLQGVRGWLVPGGLPRAGIWRSWPSAQPSLWLQQRMEELDAGVAAWMKLRQGEPLPRAASTAALVLLTVSVLVMAAPLASILLPLTWIVVSILVGFLHLGIVVFQATMLLLDLLGLAMLRICNIVGQRFSACMCRPDSARQSLTRQINAAQDYQEWKACFDRLREHDSEAQTGMDTDDRANATVRATSSPSTIGERSDMSRGKSNWFRAEMQVETDEDVLQANILGLRRAMESHDVEYIFRTLPGQLTRNHAGSGVLYDRDVSRTGMSKARPRPVVVEYRRVLKEALDFVARSGVGKAERLDALRQWRQALGHTALMLSGGGSLAMYHMGVCRELIQQGLLPKVISGTSGGSIVVAFLAIYTDEELLEHCFVNYISTCYPERWFPSLWAEFFSFLRHGVLVHPPETFFRTCQRYFGDATFAEAFARTGRPCSINISTRATSDRTGGSLLLNHITTPHVTIASAVAASCAMPGILGPGILMMKAENGELVTFSSCGNRFVDGTLQTDLPKRRLAELFNCNQFIVSQVNPHIAPFLRSNASAFEDNGKMPSPSKKRWRFEDWMAMDIKHRVQILGKLNLLPTFFGINPGNLVCQPWGEFRRGVMLVPRTLGINEAINAIRNPSLKDMDHYLLEGARCVWEQVERVQHLTEVELALDRCWELLSREPSKHLEVSNPELPARKAQGPTCAKRQNRSRRS